jgi:hypothetical protein
MIRSAVLISALMLAVTAVTAHAANWKVVTDSTAGARLLADVDTLEVQEYNNGSDSIGLSILVRMQYISNDLAGAMFSSAIDIEECLTRQQGTLVNSFGRGETQKYDWSTNGVRMYDAQGQWLCSSAITLLQSSKDKTKLSKITM